MSGSTTDGAGGHGDVELQAVIYVHPYIRGRRHRYDNPSSSSPRVKLS